MQIAGRADRQTNMTKLIDTFDNFADASKAQTVGALFFW
jgi:hypothetical protein